MANPHPTNLKPRITKENAREMQRLSTIKQNEMRARRKSLKESLDILMAKAVKKGEYVSVDDVMSIAEAEDMNITAENAIAVAMVRNAMNGDVASAVFVRDTVGEKPTDKVEVDQSVTIESWAKNHKVKL